MTSPAYKVFQHRWLASRLTAHHGDLRQVDDHGHAQTGEGILHPIDDGDEGLHAHVGARSHVGNGRRPLQLKIKADGGEDAAGQGPHAADNEDDEREQHLFSLERRWLIHCCDQLKEQKTSQ